jgi:hypothetical protein
VRVDSRRRGRGHPHEQLPRRERRREGRRRRPAVRQRPDRRGRQPVPDPASGRSPPCVEHRVTSRLAPAGLGAAAGTTHELAADAGRVDTRWVKRAHHGELDCPRVGSPSALRSANERAKLPVSGSEGVRSCRVTDGTSSSSSRSSLRRSLRRLVPARGRRRRPTTAGSLTRRLFGSSSARARSRRKCGPSLLDQAWCSRPAVPLCPRSTA